MCWDAGKSALDSFNFNLSLYSVINVGLNYFLHLVVLSSAAEFCCLTIFLAGKSGGEDLFKIGSLYS